MAATPAPAHSTPAPDQERQGAPRMPLPATHQALTPAAGHRGSAAPDRARHATSTTAPPRHGLHVPPPTLALWGAAVALATVTGAADLAIRLATLTVAAALATLAAWLWGPRIAPRMGWPWGLLVAAGTITALAAPVTAPALAAIALALMWWHAHTATPGAMLVLGTALIVLQPNAAWSKLATPEALQVGLCTTLVLAAAVWERERLARRTSHPTAAWWLTAEVALCGLLTAIIVLLRDQAEALRDLAPTTASGRVLLLALLVGCLLGATALGWRRKGRESARRLAMEPGIREVP